MQYLSTVEVLGDALFFVGTVLTISLWQFESWDIQKHFVTFELKCFENTTYSTRIF